MDKRITLTEAEKSIITGGNKNYFVHAQEECEYLEVEVVVVVVVHVHVVVVY